MEKANTVEFLSRANELKGPKFNDITLIALSEMCNKVEKLEKKVKRLRFKNSIYFGVTALAIYAVYDNLNSKLKKQNNEQDEKTEETK